MTNVKFAVLTGKALKTAIAGRAKTVATFTEREHQLAYSALMHVENHHDACHVNALLNVTPVNYKAGLIAWCKAFGKVTFDSKESTFTYSKKKESDMESAGQIAPANFQKEKGKRSTPAFDEVKQLERVLKQFNENKASTIVIKAIESALTVAKKAAVSAENKSEIVQENKPKPTPKNRKNRTGKKPTVPAGSIGVVGKPTNDSQPIKNAA